MLGVQGPVCEKGHAYPLTGGRFRFLWDTGPVDADLIKGRIDRVRTSLRRGRSSGMDDPRVLQALIDLTDCVSELADEVHRLENWVGKVPG
jgi:hypothetical protein